MAAEKASPNPVDAQRNFSDLKNNKYPGRLVLGGLDDTGSRLVLGTGITVRSEPNQNRVYERDGLLVRTVGYDPSKLPKDTENILYNAMRESHGLYIATNGKHTDTLVEELAKGTGHGSSFGDGMRKHTFEDDSSSTPRIAMAVDSRPHKLFLHTGSIYRDEDGNPIRPGGSYRLTPGIDDGYGYYLRTYEENGNPPPSYKGSPLLIPMHGSIDEITQTYWEALFEDFRVALSVQTIDINDGKVNFRTVDRYNPQVRPF